MVQNTPPAAAAGHTASWSTPGARLYDEIQHDFGEGPCLHAMNTGTTVVEADTRTDARWPEFSLAIAKHGQFSVLGVPLGLLRPGTDRHAV